MHNTDNNNNKMIQLSQSFKVFSISSESSPLTLRRSPTFDMVGSCVTASADIIADESLRFSFHRYNCEINFLQSTDISVRLVLPHYNTFKMFMSCTNHTC